MAVLAGPGLIIERSEVELLVDLCGQRVRKWAG